MWHVQYVLNEVIRDYNLQLPSIVTLRDAKDRKWKTIVKVWADGRTWLSRGWRGLCRRNLIEGKDQCICEFLPRELRNDEDNIVLKFDLAKTILPLTVFLLCLYLHFLPATVDFLQIDGSAYYRSSRALMTVDLRSLPPVSPIAASTFASSLCIMCQKEVIRDYNLQLTFNCDSCVTRKVKSGKNIVKVWADGPNNRLSGAMAKPYAEGTSLRKKINCEENLNLAKTIYPLTVFPSACFFNFSSGDGGLPPRIDGLLLLPRLEPSCGGHSGFTAAISPIAASASASLFWSSASAIATATSLAFARSFFDKEKRNRGEWGE
nr:B3 domain-containing protein At5g60140-like [Ipomoea batatas]